MRFRIYFIFIVLAAVALGQKKADQDTSSNLSQPNRIEFDIPEFGSSFTVINGEEIGLLVVEQTENRSKEGFNWAFHSVDTSLTELWNKVLPVPFESYLLGYEYHDGFYFLLFNTSRYRSEDLLVYKIDAISSDFVKMEIHTVFPIQLTFFEVLDDNILFAGYTNYRPVLLTYNMEEQKPKVVPGFYDTNSDILDIIIDDESRMFTVIQQEKMKNRRYTIVAKTFTSTGDLIQQNSISPGDKQNLVDGSSTTFYGGFQYISGTYSKKASHYSRGLYLAKFVNGKQLFIKYHEYSDLNNFFGYLTDKREKRVKDRIERKRDKGKNPKFSYRLLVHDIIQRGDEFILIAEAYYPRYSNYSNYSSPSYWPGDSRYNPSFVGYKYTHAIVVSFDRNGNIIWDNSFEINDVETYGLEEFVAVSTYEDKIVMMYLEENAIRSKVIQGKEIVEGKTLNPIRLTYTADEVKSKDPEVEGLEEWFDQTLYAYGEQRIRNEQGEGGKFYRRVFYINKVQYNLDNKTN